MPDLDAILEPPARHFKDTVANEDERREIDGIIYRIRVDPYADGETKFDFPFPPAKPILYADGRFYVVYAFENVYTLSIWDIGYDDESLLVPRPPDHR